ncbi:MAG: ATP-grasp fold amidoligase family protein, partial [Clostridium saudiense]|nr:ATP-grasp fold amidoligase family protein [Clostridium saudiense]
MDYKKIFKTPASRKMVLDVLKFIPDSIMLSIQYRIKLGRKLNKKNPRRFTEKIQLYKMNYRNPIIHQCVDKYLVRKYVKDKGLEDILIPLVAHCNSIHTIPWDKLPNKFVIKTTHGGGGLNVVVCNNKETLDIKEINEKLNFKSKPVATNSLGREWA